MNEQGKRRVRGIIAHFAKRSAWWLAAALIAFLVLSPFALRKGHIHAEAYTFLQHYLSGKDALRVIFDPNNTDWSMYNARDLSYAVDYLDCKMIGLGVDLGQPHFLSFSHYFFTVATAGLMWLFARRRLRLGSIPTLLLILLYLLTPGIALGGGYFRSSKIAVSLGLLACAYCAYPAFVRGAERRRAPQLGALLGTGAALLWMGLFDRQGVFCAMLVCLFLSVYLVLERDRTAWSWWAVNVGVLGMLRFYSHFLSPYLVEKINGYRPSLEFLEVPWKTLLTDRSTQLDVVQYAPQLLLDNLRFLYGSAPMAVALLGLAAWVWWLGPAWLGMGTNAKPGTETTTTEAGWRMPLPNAWTGRMLLAGVPLAFLVMHAAMILKFKGMVGLDFRRIYYGLPSIALFWVLGAMTLAWVLRRGLLKRRVLYGVLAILVVGNALALSEHRHIVRLGTYKALYSVSPELLEALRHLDKVPPERAAPPYYMVDYNDPKRNLYEDGLVRYFKARQLRLQSAR